MKIQTEHVRPPIPTRRFDWSAIDSDSYDGAPDSPNRNQIGYGATEAEAIEDLKEQLEQEKAGLNDNRRPTQRHPARTSH